MRSLRDLEDFITQTAIATTGAVRGTRGLLRPIADQAVRAASSAALNVSESFGRTGRDAAHHLRIALGSAREARTALLLLDGSQAHEAGADQIGGDWDRACARLYGLPRRR